MSTIKKQPITMKMYVIFYAFEDDVFEHTLGAFSEFQAIDFLLGVLPFVEVREVIEWNPLTNRPA